MKRIYLDHNASSPVRGEVLEAMLPFFSEQYGNASSIHWPGQQARRAVDRARQQVADFLGARPSEIIFCSGGTEADNLAIRGTVAASGKSHLITSAVEHPAVIQTCHDLARAGVTVTFLPVDAHGLVDPSGLDEVLTPETALVSVMLANNDTGTVQPVQQVARLARARGVATHTDAVQAAGRMALDVGQLGVNLLSLSGHKLGGPKGGGALYAKKGTMLTAQLTGGEHERGRRAGTENVPAVVGLGVACELAAEELERASAQMARLRDRLWDALSQRLEPGQQPSLNGHPKRRLPNTLNLGFPGLDGEALLLNLDLLGVAVSTGSACSSGTVEPSHVLAAMGLSREAGRSAIRISLGPQTTKEEVDAAVEALVEVLGRLSA